MDGSIFSGLGKVFKTAGGIIFVLGLVLILEQPHDIVIIIVGVLLILAGVGAFRLGCS
jgi:hypothetical protein